MLLEPSQACRDAPGSPLCAADVVRGTSRMLFQRDLIAVPEVPLANGRRVDLMALGAKGQIVIVEVKVSRADLLGDTKWHEYLDHCDQFYWAVPARFDPSPLEGAAFLPDRTGVIVADRYDAAIVRPASVVSLTAPTRKRCTLALARRAACRLLAGIDTGLVLT